MTSAEKGTPVPLLGMTLDMLREVAESLGLPRFTAAQMARWLYVQRVTDIDAMTNLSLKARERLKEGYCVGREAPLSAMRSTLFSWPTTLESGISRGPSTTSPHSLPRAVSTTT